MTPPQNSICYLICVFNDQQGLDTTLTSIFKDEPLADILIIDDGSKIPLKLPITPNGFFIELLTLKANIGLIDALNTGLEHIMRGDYKYIARIDAGDTINLGRLGAQYEYMEANPSIGMLGTQLRAFDKETGKTLFYFKNPVGAQNVSRTLKIKNCLAHPSVMIRRKVFEQVGFYDKSFKFAEDYEMWRRIENSFGVDNLINVYVNKEITTTQITAVNRRGSALSKLHAQIKYFKILDLWCWLGVMRTLLSLVIPRSILLFVRSKLSSIS